MANGSTSSMNRMKALTDKMKIPPPPGNDEFTDEEKKLMKDTIVLPTHTVEVKGNLRKKGKVHGALSKKHNTKKEQKYKRAEEFNKYAMETGISPNFDAMPDSSRTQAMKVFYSDKSNVRKMNRLQRQYFRKKK